MNITSSFRMKEIDRISIEERGFGSLLLMENAGIRILEAAETLVDFTGRSIVCAAGHGNNGGDALVIARQISSRFSNPVSIVITADEGSDAFNFNLNICRRLGLSIILFGETEADEVFSNAGIIFDGLSGTGISGALREAAAGAADSINSSSAVRIAVDVPSGLSESYQRGFPAVKADYTLTVGLPKRCLYLPSARPYCGVIRTVEIGFPDDVKNNPDIEPDGHCWTLTDETGIGRLMPVLRQDDYKNSRGHLAVIAGSPGMLGAASLCAGAAVRTPAGLVSLFSDDEIYPLLAVKHNSVMVKSRSNCGDIDYSSFSACTVGPGWGTVRRRQELERLLSSARGVLDADGINVLAEIIAETGEYPDLGGRWVLTPHAGEFRRLFSGLDPLEDPFKAAAEASETLNCVILLKGAVSFIAGGGKYTVLDGVFPKLGTAGSGDILAGLIGGYIAGGLDLYDAAVIGALVHLRAARRCGCDREWFSSEDILGYL